MHAKPFVVQRRQARIGKDIPCSSQDAGPVVLDKDTGIFDIDPGLVELHRIRFVVFDFQFCSIEQRNAPLILSVGIKTWLTAVCAGNRNIRIVEFDICFRDIECGLFCLILNVECAIDQCHSARIGRKIAPLIVRRSKRTVLEDDILAGKEQVRVADRIRILAALAGEGAMVKNHIIASKDLKIIFHFPGIRIRIRYRVSGHLECTVRNSYRFFAVSVDTQPFSLIQDKGLA